MSAGLAALQRAFLAELRAEASHGAGPGGIEAALRDGGVPRTRGLGIYRHAYAARLREALESDHAVLGTYLGDDAWALLCAGYLAAHPSRVRSLRRFGDALPAHLAQAAPFCAMPQVAEIAMLERLLLDCFDAADAPVADWPSLMARPAADWPMLRPTFHPSLRHVACEWNAVEIWSALKAGDTPPDAVRVASDWLLYRDAGRVTRFRSMAPDEVLLLGHFRDGGEFAGGCHALLTLYTPEAVPSEALRLLRQWCDDGVVAGWDSAYQS